MQLVQVRASLFGCFLLGMDTIQVYLCFSNAILGLAEHFIHDYVYLSQLLTNIFITFSACIKTSIPAAAPDFTHAAVAQMLAILKAANAIDPLGKNLYAVKL